MILVYDNDIELVHTALRLLLLMLADFRNLSIYYYLYTKFCNEPNYDHLSLLKLPLDF